MDMNCNSGAEWRMPKGVKREIANRLVSYEMLQLSKLFLFFVKGILEILQAFSNFVGSNDFFP